VDGKDTDGMGFATAAVMKGLKAVRKGGDKQQHGHRNINNH
jgi:hypothetical protein